MSAEPSVEAIEVAPYPIVLDAEPVEVVIDIATQKAPSLSGRLRAPDGSYVPLDIVDRPSPCNGQASHTFRPGDQPGLWHVEVRAGQAFAEVEFQVESRGAKVETRFADFDAQPREVDRGESVTLSGRLEVLRREGTWSPFASQTVRILFQDENSCGRRELAEAVTGDRGEFAVKVRVRSSGFWRVRFPGTARALGSQSDDLYVQAAFENQYPTDFFTYKISKSGNGIKHTGRFRGRPRGAWKWLSGKTVSVYYRKPNGPAGAFNAVGKATVTRSFPFTGRFAVLSGTSEAGHWRVEFDGDSLAGPAESQSYPPP
ncbi:hypothetical protein [Streptosporangium sp. NPDC000396]|uniref:hypothetical protein n=1 Tax=Streptosporangium sp. NPDC000396 TaxID=3366185 RepID=UPI0036A4FA4D